MKSLLETWKHKSPELHVKCFLAQVKSSRLTNKSWFYIKRVASWEYQTA